MWVKDPRRDYVQYVLVTVLKAKHISYVIATIIQISDKLYLFSYAARTERSQTLTD